MTLHISCKPSHFQIISDQILRQRFARYFAVEQNADTCIETYTMDELGIPSFSFWVVFARGGLGAFCGV